MSQTESDEHDGEEPLVEREPDGDDGRRRARAALLVEPGLVIITVGALAGGVVAWLAGWSRVADGFWIAGTVTALIPALVWVASAVRRHRAGVDVIAVLSLVGTLVVHEYLAGALIAVMLAGRRASGVARYARPARARAPVRAAPQRHAGDNDLA